VDTGSSSDFCRLTRAEAPDNVDDAGSTSISVLERSSVPVRGGLRGKVFFGNIFFYYQLL
jgi:hypothetical protein